jgi:hypothetical protein
MTLGEDDPVAVEAMLQLVYSSFTASRTNNLPNMFPLEMKRLK